MKTLFLVAVSLTLGGCVHGAESGFATSESTTMQNGKSVHTSTVCRSEVASAIDQEKESAIQTALTPDGGCARRVCRGDVCEEFGNARLRGEQQAHLAAQIQTRAREREDLRRKYGKACDDGRGSYEACKELATRLDTPEKIRIARNLCARPQEFRCVKRERPLSNGSFTVGPLVNDLNCAMNAGTPMTCTYTEIESLE